MKKSKLLIISLLLLLVSCGSSVEVKGSWNEKTYENKYFNFMITFPDDYAILADEEVEKLGNGKDVEFMIAPEDHSPLFQYYLSDSQLSNETDYANFRKELSAAFLANSEITYTVNDWEEVKIGNQTVYHLPLTYIGTWFLVHDDLYLFWKDDKIATLEVTYIDSDSQEVADILTTLSDLK